MPGKLIVLQRSLPTQSYLYEPGGQLKPDPAPDEELMRQALAHALWPTMAIKEKAYRP